VLRDNDLTCRLPILTINLDLVNMKYYTIRYRRERDGTLFAIVSQARALPVSGRNQLSLDHEIVQLLIELPKAISLDWIDST
jgi:hypothetical protein